MKDVSTSSTINVWEKFEAVSWSRTDNATANRKKTKEQNDDLQNTEQRSKE